MLLDKEKGLARKGGMFTEFMDKNIKYIDMKKNIIKTNKNKKEDVKITFPDIDVKLDTSTNKTNSQINFLSPTKRDKMKKMIIIKESNSPILEKAKEVIEKKKLYKLRNYFEKTGMFKN